MDFSLMNPSIHNKIEAPKINFQPHTFLHQQTSESSDSELSGGRIPLHFAATSSAPPPPPPPPFQDPYSITCTAPPNIHETRFSFSLQNINGDSTAAMRETIFRMAMMQPIDIEPEESSVKTLRRRNVRISKDPQSVAARHRRERISRRIRTLQRMVPGGAKLDTASMLEEAAHYLKFLKKQLQSLEQAAARSGEAAMGARLFPAAVSAVQMLC